MGSSLSSSQIKKLLLALNNELKADKITGEIFLVGGAVMCLVLNARQSTRDLDAHFRPTKALRRAASRVADEYGLDDGWLNDAAKGFFSDQATFDEYLSLSNLNIYTASSEYLLAMKCLSCRLGVEYADEEDIRFLLRYLNIRSYDEAMGVVTKYYPIERLPQKTLYALEELLGDKKGKG